MVKDYAAAECITPFYTATLAAFSLYPQNDITSPLNWTDTTNKKYMAA